MRRPRPHGVRSTCRTALRAQSPRSIPTRCAYFGFPVAFVVAETFEQATAAAALVRVRYAALPGDYDLHAAGPYAENPGRISGGEAADSAIGDFESAFANAPVKIEAIYTTPYQHQAPMEPHATMAVWEGPMLTVHTSAQLTTSPQEGLARTFNIRKEDVRIITRYVGGGFGSKLPYYVDATLAAIGARMLGRPVKVAMTRPQLFHMTTHRTASEQRLRLGADRDGRLTAYGQDALVRMRALRRLRRAGLLAARTLYAAPNRLTRHRLAKFDLPRSDSMRAPGDAIGLLALECAMDELAEALRLDPVELRLRNDTQIDPERNTAVCLAPSHRSVARRRRPLRLGQARRKAGQRPRRAVAGRLSASPAAIRGDILQSATALARLESDGRLTVELAMTDIGTGTYTILTPDCRRDDGAAASTVSPFVSATPAIRPPPARAARLDQRHPERRFSPPAENSRPGCPSVSRKPKGRSRPPRSTRATRMPASARISWRSEWIVTPARYACGACWACSRSAASSTPRRRARR